MRNLVHATGVALALAGACAAAQAADLPTRKAPPEPIFKTLHHTPARWTGPYLGLSAGANWLKTTDKPFDPVGYSAVSSAGLTYSARPGAMNISSHGVGGFAAGLYGGYNWLVSPNVVVGVEADVNRNWGKARAKGYYADAPGNPAAGSHAFAGAAAPWSGSLRARLGYTLTGNVMLYATGGLAGAQFQTDSTERTAVMLTAAKLCQLGSPCLPPTTWQVATGRFATVATHASSSNIGWTAGVGAEGFLTDSLSVKGEYLFARFPNAKIDTHAGRFGMAQHF